MGVYGGIPRDPAVELLIYGRLAGVLAGLSAFLVGNFLLHSAVAGLELYIVCAVVAYGVRMFIVFGKRKMMRDKAAIFFLQFSSGIGIYAFLVILLAFAILR